MKAIGEARRMMLKHDDVKMITVNELNAIIQDPERVDKITQFEDTSALVSGIKFKGKHFIVPMEDFI